MKKFCSAILFFAMCLALSGSALANVSTIVNAYGTGGGAGVALSATGTGTPVDPIVVDGNVTGAINELYLGDTSGLTIYWNASLTGNPLTHNLLSMDGTGHLIIRPGGVISRTTVGPGIGDTIGAGDSGNGAQATITVESGGTVSNLHWELVDFGDDDLEIPVALNVYGTVNIRDGATVSAPYGAAIVVNNINLPASAAEGITGWVTLYDLDSRTFRMYGYGYHYSRVWAPLDGFEEWAVTTVTTTRNAVWTIGGGQDVVEMILRDGFRHVIEGKVIVAANPGRYVLQGDLEIQRDGEIYIQGAFDFAGGTVTNRNPDGFLVADGAALTSSAPSVFYGYEPVDGILPSGVDRRPLTTDSSSSSGCNAGAEFGALMFVAALWVMRRR